MHEHKILIAHFEDDPMTLSDVDIYFRMIGITVEAVATTAADAVSLIPLLEKMGVHIAVIDGNLSRGNDSGNDGAAIAQSIKTKAPSIKTVGFTTSRDGIRGVDVNVRKIDGIPALAAAIHGLLPLL